MNILKKRRAIPLLGLLVMLATWLSFIPSSNAVNPSTICNNSGKSEPGSTTIQERRQTFRGYRLKLQLRSSKKNTIKWVRACVPAGTVLYLKDASDSTYTSYTAGVHGWNFGDKLRTKAPVKACAMHPSDGREFCTSLG
ncbi:hypothetical protein [Microcoleus sp. CAWBG58]|uniref:hypothetical protein n=1 Tax=Microcoleus sp. CAWBG58 TaxID=2841651 RepID=UPI0025CF148C|nr:hypothetical protein [Microcoleus sp. CAWBG58]